VTVSISVRRDGKIAREKKVEVLNQKVIILWMSPHSALQTEKPG